MLLDGLKLTEGSSADNLNIAAGFEFPANASVGELFLKVGTGLFYSGADWTQLSTLDADGKLVLTQVPSLAINNTTVVGSEAAMLRLLGLQSAGVRATTPHPSTDSKTWCV